MNTKFYIPENYRIGFEALMSLDIKLIETLIKRVNDFPPGNGPKTFIDHMSKLEIPDIRAISDTLYSFGSLLINHTGPIEDITEGLIDAYVERTQKSGDKVKLLKHLTFVFNNINPIKLSSKGLELIMNVRNAYRSSVIITDIRPVFNDEIDNPNRYAIISQQLKITYTNENGDREIFINLDSLDLEELKSQIERAQKKESIIRKDYASSFTFYELNSNAN